MQSMKNPVNGFFRLLVTVFFFSTVLIIVKPYVSTIDTAITANLHIFADVGNKNRA